MFATAETASDLAGGVRRRIGIDASRAFVARPTGTERYSSAVIRHLLAQGGHDYRLYFRAAPAVPPPPGAELRVIPCPRLWTHVRLATEVARRTPDVLFVPAHVMPIVCRPPAVVTVHDLGFLAFPDAHPAVQRCYLDWTTRRHARRAAVVIADSAATRADLVASYGADPARIEVVHLGVDESFRRADPPAIERTRRGLGLAPGRTYVLHVGTRQPRKNLRRLLLAFAQIAPGRPDLDLILAGAPGWGADDLAGVASAQGLGGRVVFADYVPEPELAALYSGAVAVVLPSLYEGFGLPAVEAMACGTPVAASRGSSLVEVVGDAGLLFDPHDVVEIASAVARLVDDPDLRSRLVEAGRCRAAQFTWARCASAIRAVLERVAAGGARHRVPPDDRVERS